MLASTPVRASSLHDGVATRLRALVFDGLLAPGAWIDEEPWPNNGR
jgi:DNA-binding GntR family transcriptional regulator